MRAAAAGAGLLGGLCWVGALWVDALAWAGAVLLAVAALGFGAGLVSRSAVWLRCIVAVCFVALAVSVLQVLQDSLDDRTVLAATGAVAFVVAAAALARRPAPVARSRGSHAA